MILQSTHDPKNPLRVETVCFHSSFCAEENPALACVLRHQQGDGEQAALWLAAAVGEFLHPAGENITSRQQMVRSWCRWLDDRVGEAFSLEDLCRQAGYSKNHVIRLFKEYVRETPWQYFLRCRVRKGASLLLYTNDPIEKIAADTGFYDVAHFSRYFKRVMGYSPRRQRQDLQKRPDEGQIQKNL